MYDEIYNAVLQKYGIDTNGQWCVVAGTLTNLLYTLVLPNNTGSDDFASINISISEVAHILGRLNADNIIDVDVAALSFIESQSSLDPAIATDALTLLCIMGRSNQDDIPSSDTIVLSCILGRISLDNITSSDTIALSSLHPKSYSDIAVTNTGMVAAHILSRNWIDSVTATEVVRRH